ncbi:hypothetical protein J6590_054321 [Homalodisca vitripennis]|nr:hypothetical protein J6590_054321 [Homalodisca vitripennis]
MKFTKYDEHSEGNEFRKQSFEEPQFTGWTYNCLRSEVRSGSWIVEGSEVNKVEHIECAPPSCVSGRPSIDTYYSIAT